MDQLIYLKYQLLLLLATNFIIKSDNLVLEKNDFYSSFLEQLKTQLLKRSSKLVSSVCVRVLKKVVPKHVLSIDLWFYTAFASRMV